MCDLEMLGIEADPFTRQVIDDLCQSGCHVSSIKLKILSLDALRLACGRLGLEFREDQKTYAWFGRYQGDSPVPEGFTQ